MRTIYYNLKYGIQNLIRWFKVIWSDRDWDQYFFYRILVNKFEHMEYFFRNDANFVDKEKVADKIMIAKNLAKRLMEDDYLNNATVDYDKIYGNDELFIFEPVKNEKYSKLVEVGTKHQHDMFGKASKHSDKMRQQDKEILFDLIKKNIDRWWD